MERKQNEASSPARPEAAHRHVAAESHAARGTVGTSPPAGVKRSAISVALRFFVPLGAFLVPLPGYRVAGGPPGGLEEKTAPERSSRGIVERD